MEPTPTLASISQSGGTITSPDIHKDSPESPDRDMEIDIGPSPKSPELPPKTRGGANLVLPLDAQMGEDRGAAIIQSLRGDKPRRRSRREEAAGGGSSAAGGRSSRRKRKADDFDMDNPGELSSSFLSDGASFHINSPFAGTEAEFFDMGTQKNTGRSASFTLSPKSSQKMGGYASPSVLSPARPSADGNSPQQPQSPPPQLGQPQTQGHHSVGASSATKADTRRAHLRQGLHGAQRGADGQQPSAATMMAQISANASSRATSPAGTRTPPENGAKAGPPPRLKEIVSRLDGTAAAAAAGPPKKLTHQPTHHHDPQACHGAVGHTTNIGRGNHTVVGHSAVGTAPNSNHTIHNSGGAGRGMGAHSFRRVADAARDVAATQPVVQAQSHQIQSSVSHSLPPGSDLPPGNLGHNTSSAANNILGHTASRLGGNASFHDKMQPRKYKQQSSSPDASSQSAAASKRTLFNVMKKASAAGGGSSVAQAAAGRPAAATANDIVMGSGSGNHTVAPIQGHQTHDLGVTEDSVHSSIGLAIQHGHTRGRGPNNVTSSRGIQDAGHSRGTQHTATQGTPIGVSGGAGGVQDILRRRAAQAQGARSHAQLTVNTDSGSSPPPAVVSHSVGSKPRRAGLQAIQSKHLGGSDRAQSHSPPASSGSESVRDMLNRQVNSQSPAGGSSGGPPQRTTSPQSPPRSGSSAHQIPSTLSQVNALSQSSVTQSSKTSPHSKSSAASSQVSHTMQHRMGSAVGGGAAHKIPRSPGANESPGGRHGLPFSPSG